MKKLLAFVILLALFSIGVSPALATYGVQTKTTGCTADLALPDPGCTPGAVLTTDTTIICAKGYTKTVRNVPLAKRKQVFAEYGIPYTLHSQYEIDHLISLELGGSNDISNLWPEPYGTANSARTKDGFENYLHAQVCKGIMAITDAQAEISGNWLAYYQALAINKTKAKSIKRPAPPVSTTSRPVPIQPPISSPPTSPMISSGGSAPALTGSTAPASATARCRDGTYSFSRTHSGACSRHGGVAAWY